MNYSKEFLDKTIQIWQPYSQAVLTQEDAREITENVVSLGRFLGKLDKKYNCSGQS